MLQRPAGQLERDCAACSPVPSRTTGKQRHTVQVVVRVEVLLLAVGIDGLTEIAVPVHQADADEGHTQVAGGLGVIAGKHTQTPGVDLQALVPPVLGGEVGHGATVVVGVVPPEPRRLHGRHVLVEALDDLPVLADEALVLLQLVPALGLEIDQQLDGIAVVDPAWPVDAVEQPVRAGSPGPPEVVGDVPQPRELQGQVDLGRGLGLDLGVAHPTPVRGTPSGRAEPSASRPG